MYKYLFLIFLFQLFFKPLLAQKANKDTLRNRIEVFYAPSMTKTNLVLERFASDIYLDWFAYLYTTTQKPTLPVDGRTFGIKYYKDISKRSFYSVGLSHMKAGIKSIQFEYPNISPDPDQPYIPKDFLISYELELLSWQAPIQYYLKPFIKNIKGKKPPQKKWKDNIYFNLNFVPDFHQLISERFFKHDKKTGDKEMGGITNGRFFHGPAFLEGIYHGQHILNSVTMIRLGLGLGTGLNYPLTQKINISITFNLMYYTEALFDKGEYFPAGDIYTADVSIGIGYVFDQKSKKERMLKKRAKKRKLNKN